MSTSSTTSKTSSLDEIMRQEELKKEKMNRLDYWITPGIIVKVKHKTLANGYVLLERKLSLLSPVRS